MLTAGTWSCARICATPPAVIYTYLELDKTYDAIKSLCPLVFPVADTLSAF